MQIALQITIERALPSPNKLTDPVFCQSYLGIYGLLIQLNLLYTLTYQEPHWGKASRKVEFEYFCLKVKNLKKGYQVSNIKKQFSVFVSN